MQKIISITLLVSLFSLTASMDQDLSEDLSGATAGSTVIFGSYEQGNGQAPIEC